MRPSRPADPTRHFLDAVQVKYASEYTLADGRRAAEEIVFFGKRAEEVGFEKIRHQQANIAELKVVIVDDLQLDAAYAQGEREEEGLIGRTCPKITQLDLSRNLFDTLGPVADICRELPALNCLRLGWVPILACLGRFFADLCHSGNRFQRIREHRSEGAYDGVLELFLEDTMMQWEEMCHVAAECPSLTSLVATSNQLYHLPLVDYSHLLSSTLKSLTLEFNDFSTLADVASITPLTKLRNLHLKGNNITTLAPDGTDLPVFPPSVEYLDLSYNNIQSWSFVDNLPKHFPGLKSLRISHNPVYDGADVDANPASSEESYMFAIARLGALKSLNFSQITAEDRSNAEMFYLSRIGKQLAAVAETEEADIIALHPRYYELCEMYGGPVILRRPEVNPAFLDARLITVGFRSRDGAEKTARIPKAVDIYAVKGIAGKLFGEGPLDLKLIWETGEWDPVAGFDDQEGDSSDEEAEEEERERRGDDTHGAEDAADRPGRWIKREVELKEGPRQLGYCVDGVDVKIRVEAR